MVDGKGNKHFASRIPEIIVGGALPLPPLQSWTPGSWLWERQHHTLQADLKHIQPPGRHCLSLTGIVHLAG